MLLILTGCASIKKIESPYSLSGEMAENDSGSGWVYGLNFVNNSPKLVKKIDFVLSLYDEDGEPVFEADWIEFSIERFVSENESVSVSFPLDDFFEELPEYAYMTDYFYAARIEYADGSVFEDPLGRFSE